MSISVLMYPKFNANSVILVYRTQSLVLVGRPGSVK